MDKARHFLWIEICVLVSRVCFSIGMEPFNDPENSTTFSSPEWCRRWWGRWGPWGRWCHDVNGPLSGIRWTKAVGCHSNSNLQGMTVAESELMFLRVHSPQKGGSSLQIARPQKTGSRFGGPAVSWMQTPTWRCHLEGPLGTSVGKSQVDEEVDR